MKLWLQQLFSENGGVSMVRLLSLICVLTASMLALLGIYSTTHNLEAVALLCGTFLTAGLGAKVLQKRTEVASNSASQSETVAANLSESVQNGDDK